MIGEAREVMGYPRLYVSIALQTFYAIALSEHYEALPSMSRSATLAFPAQSAL